MPVTCNPLAVLSSKTGAQTWKPTSATASLLVGVAPCTTLGYPWQVSDCATLQTQFTPRSDVIGAETEEKASMTPMGAYH